MESKKWCMATHPKMPNRSGHARGRVVHAVKEGKKTFCNMLVDGIFTTNNRFIVEFRRKCKICFPAVTNSTDPITQAKIESAYQEHLKG